MGVSFSVRSCSFSRWRGLLAMLADTDESKLLLVFPSKVVEAENCIKLVSKEAEAGRERGGGWEAEAVRVSAHWANLLRSGLLAGDCGGATPEMHKKLPPLGGMS